MISLGTYPSTQITSTVSPQRQQEVGFFNRHIVGALDYTQRNFSPTAARFKNLASTSSSGWIGCGGVNTCTAVTAPDGTSNAEQASTTSSSVQNLFFYEAPSTIALGDYWIGGAWVRSQTANGYGNGGTQGTNISITGAGNLTTTEHCVTDTTIGDGQWSWQYCLLKITQATTSPSEVLFSTYFVSGHVVQAYAPVLVRVPSGTISDNEAYALAAALTSFDSNCSVGAICGLNGQRLTPALIGTLSNCSSSASPAVCGSAASGSVAIGASSTSVVVDTTAVTTNSQIVVTFDTSLGTKLGVTCNKTAQQPYVSERTAGKNFTISVASTFSGHPGCFSYLIVN
jgi:hypothetical protein